MSEKPKAYWGGVFLPVPGTKKRGTEYYGDNMLGRIMMNVPV